MTEHRLITNGELHLTGPVGYLDWDDEGFTVRDVTEALSEIDGDITVRINSGGGFAFDGIAIHSLLRQYDGTVTTVAQGIAASAASVIFMAGEDRVMAEGAMLMIHDAAGITMGTEADHLKTAKGLGKLSNSLAGIYARATKRGIDVERAAMREETWLDGAEAVEAGFATSETDGDAAEASAFDYTLYMNAPAFLVKRARDVAHGHEQAALSATNRQPSKEDDMTKTPDDKVVADTKAAPEPEVKIDIDAIKAEAAKAESARIQECQAVFGMADASDATKALAFDGKSDAGAVALAVLADAQAKGADHLAKLAKSEAEMVDAGLKTAPSATVSEVKKTETAATPDGWKAAWEASEDLRAEYVKVEDYVSYMTANRAGRIKVQGK